MLTLRKRGLIWHVRGTVAGRSIEASTGCTDRRAAEAYARDLERDLADPAGAARRARSSTSLQTAVDIAAERYEADAAAGRCSPETVSFYRRKWGQLLRILDGRSLIADYDIATTYRFVNQRRSEGMSEHTIVKEVTALRVALKVARDTGLWSGHLDDLVPSDLRSDYVPRTRALSLAEAQKLLRELSPDRAAWVALMIGAGAEISAAERCERLDYDRAARLIHVRGQKNESRDRHVPVLLPACRELIELAWAHGQGKGDRLLRAWGKNWRDLQTACERAGIEACSAHDLRRTFAHWHLEAGLSYDDVARALGHKDTTMLHRVYGKLPAPALRDRMAQALNSAQLVPSKGRAKGRKVQIKQSPDPRVSATNQGFSEYRRSELNQRPWDYDSPALTD